MSKQTNKLIALALVGACGFGAWKLGTALIADDDQGTKHAVNQLWIDHVPRDDRDMLTHLMIIDHRDGQFGAIGRSSQWRHMIDVFKWQLRGSELNMYFPQDRVRGQVSIETWECEGEAPSPFQLCMKLTNKNGRSAVLYSRHDWKIEPRDVDDSIDEIVDDTPALAGLLHALDDDAAERVGELELDEAEGWSLHDLGL